MIQRLTLKNFKSFSEPKGHEGQWEGASIDFGGLSLIIGTNASGKSNIRDGLRFIHGISRGYSLSEIIGEKYVGGAIQWEGIRGGVRETVTRNGDLFDTQFTISVQTNLEDVDGGGTADYSITVDVGDRSQAPFVVRESLSLSGSLVFETIGPAGPRHVLVSIPINSAEVSVGNEQPTILPLSYDDTFDIPKHCRAFLRTIRSVRFLELDPNPLRRPSIPGQTELGDKGENLSSVLQAICADATAKESLIEWTRELTPLDVVDLKFPEVSLEGKIQLQLVEHGGREISAESASDGTLRFLAFAAAVLGTEPARFYFFEEIENGIHPNRAHLLINLLQTATSNGGVQVVGTTHSPALLNYLDEDALKNASLVYRVGPVSKIARLGEIKALGQTPAGTRAGDLLSSGWFEDVAAFLEAENQQ
ncbi:MAG: AAA family ATPase [Acidobacteriota bacterium]